MPVQQQTPLDFRITLFRVQTVIRRQDAHLMPALLQGFRDGFAAEIKRSRVVRWEQIG